MIISRAFIDNGSTLSVCPATTLSISVKDSMIRPNRMMYKHLMAPKHLFVVR